MCSRVCVSKRSAGAFQHWGDLAGGLVGELNAGMNVVETNFWLDCIGGIVVVEQSRKVQPCSIFPVGT